MRTKTGFLLSVLSLLLVFAMLAISCSKSAQSPSTTSSSKPSTTTTSAATTTAKTTAPSPSSTTSAKPSTTTTQAPSATPQTGGTLKLIFSASPSALGYPPELTNLLWWYSAIPAMETLFRFDKDGRPLPFLATDWKTATDSKSITVNLRQGVKFHDGTDFDADAVKYNLDLQISAKNASLAKITSIDVVSPYTIRLNLSSYDNALLTSLGQVAGLMASPAVLKKGADFARFNPVGTGPFKFVSYDKDVSLKYSKNTNYWDKGKPYLDGIEYAYIRDPNTAAAAFQSGSGHLLWGSASTTPKGAYDISSKGFKVATVSSNMLFLAPDSSNAGSPFADVRVRQAVEYALDRPAIVKALSYGFWRPMTQAATSDSAAFNPALAPRNQDKAKAKELLAAAGYGSGFKTVILTSQATLNKDAMTAIQGQLAEVGITADIDVMDAGRTAATEKDGWKNSMYTPMVPSIGHYGVNMNRRFPPNGSLMPSVTRPKEYVDLFNTMLSATDFSVQNKATQDLVKLIYDQALLIPLWDNTVFVAKQADVRDDEHATVLNVFWAPEKAWLAKK